MNFTESSIANIMIAKLNTKDFDKFMNETADRKSAGMLDIHVSAIKNSLIYWRNFSDKVSQFEIDYCDELLSSMKECYEKHLTNIEFYSSITKLIASLEQLEKRCKELCCADWEEHNYVLYRAVRTSSYQNELRYPIISCSVRNDVLYQDRHVAVMYRMNPETLVGMSTFDSNSARTTIELDDDALFEFPYASKAIPIISTLGVTDIFMGYIDYMDKLLHNVREHSKETGEIILSSDATPIGVFIGSRARKEEIAWAKGYATVYGLEINYEVDGN